MFRRKPQTQLIAGLDIGSTAVRIGVASYEPDMKGDGNIQIIGAAAVPSFGIHKGVISSIDETVSALSGALEQVERIVGAPIAHAWVGISGTHFISQASKGVVAAAKPNGDITDEDVSRAVEAARMVAPPLNYEVLHVLPKSFTVDGQEGIRNPIGMTGIRLEVDTQIIYGVTAHLKNITKAVYRTGIDIDDLVLSILAAGEIVTTSRQRELGVSIIDIGGSTTTVVVYEDGDVLHTATIPIGSEHITNDLAIGLRSSIDVAERVKIEFANCTPESYDKKDMLDLADVGAPSEMISRKYIAEIVEARVTEILEKINDELMKVDRSGLLPAGAYFIGGGARIDGLIPLAKRELELPVALGYPIDTQSISDKVNDISFASTFGLIRWAVEVLEHRHTGGQRKAFSGGTKVMDKIQDVWRSLIP